MIDVDLAELPDAVLQRLHPVVAAVGVAQVLEDGEAMVVSRDRQRLIPASARGKAGEMDDAEIVLRLLQLVEHGGAVHPVELQAAGERRDAFVPPQVQWVRRKQNGLPRGPSALQGRPDLNDIERRDGFEEELRPGVIDLVHGRVVLREPGVEPVTGLQERRRRRAEVGPAGEGQHGLMQQKVDMPEDGSPGCGHAIPAAAQVLVHAADRQLPLHGVEERPQVVPLPVMRNRPLQRFETRRIALTMVPKGVLEGRARRFDHPAPGVVRAEEANPSQNVALDRELERAFVAVHFVLPARGVFLSFDGLGQCLLNPAGERLELLVIAIDQQLAAIRGHRAAVADARPLRIVRVVGCRRRARSRSEDVARLLVVEAAVRIEAAAAADSVDSFEHVQAPGPLFRAATLHPLADVVQPAAGHPGDVLGQLEIGQQASGDLPGIAQEIAVRQNPEPRQRTPGRAEIVVAARFPPLGEELRDPAQRHQRTEVPGLLQRLQERPLRRRGRERRLLRAGPAKQAAGEFAGVPPGEVRQGADARVAPPGESDDPRVDLRLVTPPGGDVQIGRDVADGEPQSVDPLAQIGFGRPVAGEGERSPGGVFGFLRERGKEMLDVHGRELVAKEVAALPNGLRGLQSRGPGNVDAADQSASPTFLEQSTSPSDGSTARWRPFRRSANAAALRSRSASSKPKYPWSRRAS